jgi:hypothetical protein
MPRPGVDRVLLLYFWAVLPSLIIAVAMATGLGRLMWMLVSWILLTPIFTVAVCRSTSDLDDT